MTKLTLDTPIDQVFMIGPAYAKRLNKLNIHTVNHFLHHYPTRYQDLRNITHTGKIIKAQNLFTRSRKQIQKAIIQTETQTIEAIWFNQPFLTKTLKAGLTINLAAEQKFFAGKLSLVSPEYELVSPDKPPIHTNRLVPIYPETAGLSSKWIRSRLFWLLNNLKKELNFDWLPFNIIKQHKLVNLSTAVQTVHFPDSESQIKSSRYRLAFDEMFLLQLEALVKKRQWQQKKLSHQFKKFPKKTASLISNLPFKLTKSQLACMKSVLLDLKSNKPMNRLLQGDVGSGKTVVAAIAMYLSYLNGFQSILLAPTEILANQHYRTLKSVFAKTKLRFRLITSSTKTTNLDGDILVGTHALFFRKIKLSNLGLLVIDEQHRFGVNQRSKFLGSSTVPHLLSMTATPIPRTIALSTYAHLDLSVIDEMPPNRIPIKTWLVSPNKQLDAYHWIKAQILNQNTQAFVVCPLIESSSSETLKDIKNVTDHFNQLNSILPSLEIELLHGKLKSKQKELILKRFSQNKTNILVSTQVIEVGLDIPNATIMVIENADHFGLAQLHQLRGRVGRGKKQSYCLLLTQSKNPSNNQRLKAMEQYQSGFKLAELDLRLRGAGDLYGLKQHGFMDLKLASFSDPVLVSLSQQAASSVVDKLTPSLKAMLNNRKIGFVALN
jgi:ATP-dependent DNA helicase RecG